MRVKICSWNSIDPASLVIPDQFSRSLRRADEYIRVGVAAGHAALESVNMSQDTDSIGMVVSSGFGPLETNFEILDQLVLEQPTSPTLFSHSVFNAAAGYMATTLGLQGPALTITELEAPFFRALEQANLLMVSGLVDSCLVLQIETYDELLQDVRGKQGKNIETWKPGAVCWYLGKIDDGIELTDLDVRYELKKKDDYLRYREQLIVEGKSEETGHPMGGIVTLTDMLAEFEGEVRVRVENPYGVVRLGLNR